MNFCVENIGTSISCNQVESDGNEAIKLLQEDPFSPNSKKPFIPLSSRGFLADYFVRCPVTLSIKFPTCIEISHIIITPKLGSQTASAFLLETITSYKVWTRGTVTDSPISKFIVGKEYLNPGQQIPRQIIFCNPRYQPRPPFSRLSSAKTASSSLSSNSQIIFNLKHPSSNACERVIGLDVTILRSVGSSTPCLGGLEIWGQPCSRCPPEIVNKLLVTWLRRNRKPIINAVPNPEIEKKNLKSPLRNNSSTDDDDEQSLRSTAKRRKLQLMESANKAANVHIPEEFIDAITYEIMVQPIRLPCGIAVDSSTLQKFYMEEAVWGRKPSDPFTGQPYTDLLKPVVDTPLKIRIDKFLTSNYTAMNLQGLPRTIGTGKSGFSSIDHRVSNNTNNLTMMMMMNNPKSSLSQTTIHSSSSSSRNIKRKINSNNNNNDNNNSDSSTSSASPPPPPILHMLSGKLEKTSTVTSASVLISESSNNNNSNLNTNVPSPTSPLPPPPQTPIKTTVETMEDKLQKELAKILGNDAHSSYFLPKPSKPSSSSPLPLTLSDQSYQTQKCIKCSKTFVSDSDGDIFYTTAKMSVCSHIIICRNCLLALDKQISHHCSICQTEWEIKELYRLRK